MRVLYLTSELSPLISTGGLAEVAYALPKALHSLGIDVRVALPKYKTLNLEDNYVPLTPTIFSQSTNNYQAFLYESRVPNTNIPLLLLEHNEFFWRDYIYGHSNWEYEDNPKRFCFFCNAILDGLERIDWQPDLIHCNDWQTSATPAFLLFRKECNNMFWGNTKTLLTIHNLAFQGRYPKHRYATTGLPPELLSNSCFEHMGDMNLLKGGIILANQINTVSPTYAKEIQTLEYGFGLDNILKTRSNNLTGILNGVDYSIWSPSNDKFIANNYSINTINEKSLCKLALQSRVGLPIKDIPLIGLTSRLYWQKGIDILLQSLPEILQLDVQIIILGTGDEYFEQNLKQLEHDYPDKIRVFIGYDVSLSHQIIAGSDFILMPSRYEPCGLTQLYALAYGTIPIVRKVGGLADSVVNINTSTVRNQSANGLTFRTLTPRSIIRCIKGAIDIYNNKSLLNQIRINGMKLNFSWENQAKKYIELYERIMYDE